MNGSLTLYNQVPLPHSPLLLCNNLQLHRGGECVSYATSTAVYTIGTSTGTPCFDPFRILGDRVQHIAALDDPAETNIILVVLCARAADIVVNGQRTHTFSAEGRDALLTCTAVTRVAGKNEMVVAVGTSDGTPLCRHYTLQGEPVSSQEVTVPVQAHASRSLTALDLEIVEGVAYVQMASGDAGGYVTLWEGNNITRVIPPESDTDAVTCVRLIAASDTVAVAYGGGQVRVVQRSTGAATIVIQAHSRWINTMVYSAAHHCLASAAEDGQISVWDLASVDPNSVCIASGAVANELPTGLAFLGNASALVAVSYDVLKLRFFSIPGTGR
ncbi:hypothetical protein JKF63_07182 [Porcisia hertigi]|uniref:WD repeat-containing protein 54 beta-propeller domain-containing protein n=1 Tax=Porcisia hertigi TaxID=2761500 RepID=A0A836LKH0_9TRYP|nr:hypothetical protein JKF63_07182 [Porcisia hertigi]